MSSGDTVLSASGVGLNVLTTGHTENGEGYQFRFAGHDQGDGTTLYMGMSFHVHDGSPPTSLLDFSKTYNITVKEV